MIHLHETVTFRRYPGDHEQTGRVVGRTYGRPPHRYTVTDERGQTHEATDVTEVRTE